MLSTVSEALLPYCLLATSTAPTSSCWALHHSKRRENQENDSAENQEQQHINGGVNINATLVSPSVSEDAIVRRVTQLEQLVAKQAIEIRRLQGESKDLAEAAAAFARVIELMREAGLTSDIESKNDIGQQQSPMDSTETETTVTEYFDDAEIFGKAPASVIEAADAAGAAILAMMLAGKQRMLVDVRDAELSSDAETLVQFIELAILPVAAGLEGLMSQRNRLKIVFPTVSQLLTYRKTMALAAPEVVALSTFGLEPVEKQDNLVVIVAPAPDDEEGLVAMEELLDPPPGTKNPIKQPIVVLNHHMVPITGPAANFEVAYHLRLLTVQYMSGNRAKPSFYSQYQDVDPPALPVNDEAGNSTALGVDDDFDQPGDDALAAAVKHAHETGGFEGMTRAMVIRAYPKPWHVFVDTSPGTDADFEVAAMFGDEPSTQDVNLAIVECLEGSEQEDELVAQQMQEALESGQLDRVSRMLKLLEEEDEANEDDDSENDPWDLRGADSV